MDKEIQVITVASYRELMCEVYYRRLWLAVRNIKIPRRSWPDLLADTFRDYNGIFHDPNGGEYELPEIDDVFNGIDMSMRWFGYYVAADETGQHPRSRTRKLERLRLFDLYFRILYPHIAAQFGR